MRGIMFAVLFGVIAYTTKINFWMTLVFALFALFNFFEIRRFVSIIRRYDSLERKLADFICSCGKDAVVEPVENLILFLIRNATMLVIFYAVFLAACLYVMPITWSNYAEGAGSAVMILLFLKMKLDALNVVWDCKHHLAELGETADELSAGGNKSAC